MSAAQIRFFALVRRECNRFLKIKRQTIGAPLLETFLYISVFGAALGTSAELAAKFGVTSLEDAYLELVGRKELSRARVEVEGDVAA